MCPYLGFISWLNPFALIPTNKIMNVKVLYKPSSIMKTLRLLFSTNTSANHHHHHHHLCLLSNQSCLPRFSLFLPHNGNYWAPLTLDWFWPLEFWPLNATHSLTLTSNQRLSGMKGTPTTHILLDPPVHSPPHWIQSSNKDLSISRCRLLNQWTRMLMRKCLFTWWLKRHCL